MQIREGNLIFNFTGASDCFKFDEENKNHPRFHGLSHCMKAVDFIVEYQDYYLFIEVKDIPSQYSEQQNQQELINRLVYKFRDSFLYRWAEEKLDKSIKYLCLIELENPQICWLMDELKRKLPEKYSKRWKKNPATTCIVANIKSWNESLPWKISRV